ncbi:hypothetical protein MACH26_31390 [Planctobacterium marinum]|uniref:Uncharacterized protein n=1 Tax=Planctobacterium marinum TaxID=1631968 RepID=A0AA48HXD2_9ALTE|nr:hypothetical protein MACH26_31390 [Planctobacterium marinum]
MQLEKAFELLKSQGYIDTCNEPLNSADFKKIATDHQKLVLIEHTIELPERQLELDIHWKLRRNALLPIEYSDLFNSIKSDNTVPRLIEPLEFIYLCVCGTNDGWQKLKSVVDILYYAQLIEDWTVVNKLADRLGLAHIVNASLAVCDYFFGTCYGPIQLSRKEHTICAFVISSYLKYGEIPHVHGYINNSNLYQFAKSTLSWWMAINSDLVSPLTVLRELATPNNEDIAKGTLSDESGMVSQLLKRLVRIVRKYYMAKRD